MKAKTRTLTYRALEYAVALAEGTFKVREALMAEADVQAFIRHQRRGGYLYVTGPAGDDIIDREMITTDAGDGSFKGDRTWEAHLPNQIPMHKDEEITGSDRRTAAMRCWCVFKLGEEVEIPDELMTP